MLYVFHKFNSLVSNRLKRLRCMNPDVIFIPFLGIQQRIYFPTLVNLPWAPTKILNLTFLKFSHILELSKIINKNLESIRQKNAINAVREALHREGNLYCDFTPMGYFNQDLAILSWFSSEGVNLDFDHLIFYEYDMFTTKPIEKLYSEYASYDAGFVNYGEVTPSWYWYANPPGAKESILRWLKNHKLKPQLYKGLFAGHIVSRRVLKCLEKTPLPFGFCELRWPSIISGLGFRCVQLSFPMVRYGEPVKKSEIIKNERLGIFHPVYENLDEIV